ncbi:Uncharacterised protein (plasmid) [Legionella adelaidensis]|uniref:Uncharacterized protein n=1 Tax=Legionella adelaidensis TaxID=45056 RepID=A0A0W0R0I0_9GAMM|nr:helix-turn-helix domain-containing protein [Legionella adelaidensis]KTC64604.1 hypothetical protein Lade_1898 [Legionella adelaidensis]VEH86072.1 Uncharacterised protein [Legionella adelaidensis]
MFKYYNSHLVKQYRSYTVEQICDLFKEKKLHPQTVRDWVKSDDLETITRKPILIYGATLKDFLEKRNASHKKQLEFNQFKCLKCQEIIIPQNNTISMYKNKNGSIKAAATCPACNNKIARFYKQNEQVKLEGTFVINEAQLVTICNLSPTAGKTHLNSTANNGSSEPSRIMQDTS